MPNLKRGYNKFFALSFDGNGEVDQYVYLDTSTMWKTNTGKLAFEDAVSFGLKQRGGLADNYPVVYEDFTVYGGGTLTPIEFADIPAPIKRRYKRWEKVQ